MGIYRWHIPITELAGIEDALYIQWVGIFFFVVHMKASGLSNRPTIALDYQLLLQGVFFFIFLLSRNYKQLNLRVTTSMSQCFNSVIIGIQLTCCISGSLLIVSGTVDVLAWRTSCERVIILPELPCLEIRLKNTVETNRNISSSVEFFD